MELLASCAFGLEALVARELQSLGYETKVVSPGQIAFAGSWQDIAAANLWLRCADRVSIVIAQFECPDFDALFDTTKSLAWSEWLSDDAFIHVTGSSVKSQLTSVPAIQRTAKKAIVEGLLKSTSSNTLPESGPKHRVHVSLRDDVARLTLDTTGPSLHKRGYREIATKAPLKETLAAALVQLSFWKNGRPLIDPFCGGGTILIEAAMIGRNLAPGQAREFESELWRSFPQNVWTEQREAAKAKSTAQLDERLIGRDIHRGALSLARRNADMAGVGEDVHFEPGAFADLSSKRQHGQIICNPPYGERIHPAELRDLYESMPGVLSRLPTWSHFILTAYPGFEKTIGKQANRRRKLYNGRIECTYYQFHGPKPNQTADGALLESVATGSSDGAPNGDSNVSSNDDAKGKPNGEPNGEANGEASKSSRAHAVAPVFGANPQDFRGQQEIFANRLRKRARHLRRWPKRGITCYRLYERDIPEIPLVVDRFEDCLHIVEFERPHERGLAQHAAWLEAMAQTAGRALDVDPNRVFVKSRQRQRGTTQHERRGKSTHELTVNEGGLKFLVNLADYTDTGLFLDHRNARSIIREMAPDQRVLNLFAYTGSFSVYAAAGGASEVTTVDWSNTYIQWAQRNFALNQLDDSKRFRFQRADAREFVFSLPSTAQYDIVICDPPTFSNSKRSEEVWDVQQHHSDLIRKLLKHLADDGVILFSSNYRRLKLDEDKLQKARVREITKQTLPEEYRNRRIHRSWLIAPPQP